MSTTAVIPHRERTGHDSNEDYPKLIASRWHNLFVAHREALSSVARILTEGPCSPAVVLFNAEFKIKDQDIPAEFKYRYAIRSVVLAALVMPSLEQCPDGFELIERGCADLSDFEGRMAVLPRLERSVVFLRDVLGYSRRETGLLMGIPDSQVDDSLYSGRNRLLRPREEIFKRVKPYFHASGSLSSEQVTATDVHVANPQWLQ